MGTPGRDLRELTAAVPRGRWPYCQRCSVSDPAFGSGLVRPRRQTRAGNQVPRSRPRFHGDRHTCSPCLWHFVGSHQAGCWGPLHRPHSEDRWREGQAGSESGPVSTPLGIGAESEQCPQLTKPQLTARASHGRTRERAGACPKHTQRHALLQGTRGDHATCVSSPTHYEAPGDGSSSRLWVSGPRGSPSYLQLQLLPVQGLGAASDVATGIIVHMRRGVPGRARRETVRCLPPGASA